MARVKSVSEDGGRRGRLLALGFLLLAGLLLFVVHTRLAEAATPPPGFEDSLVADVPSPTALAFTPDGRMIVATQPGKLQVFDEGGALLKDGALNLAGKVCATSERGLLGVAVDPGFVTNEFIYVYYTTNETGGCKNRVARYELSDAGAATNPNTAAFSKVLIDGIPSPGGNHNAGDLHFGNDGYLYVSVGDGGTDYAGGGSAGANDAARDPHVLLGKILRVDRDGGIPSTNPNASTGDICGEPKGDGRTSAGRTCKETFASGLRNPFRMAFDPDAAGTRFFINDVGQNAWEEIDEGRAGADYGWNVREGFCANGSTSNCRNVPGATVNGLTDPVHAYGRGVGASITGGAFVPDGVWPAEYDDSYLFADYVSGKIFRLEPNGGGYARTEFVTGMGGGSATSMAFGPYGDGQALYYTSYANGGDVRRLAYTGPVNRTPTASVTATPTSGQLPLVVDFDGSGSSDPDGGALTYLWDFGDGTTAETATSATSHTYAADGSYTATLRVRDDHNPPATSNPAQVQIKAGNEAPTPRIISPSTSFLFRVGQEITLTGGATDPEDGTLADDELSWEVIRHHNDSHTHPYLQPTTGNNVEITAPPPEDLAATGSGNYLEIRLTATDSNGTSRTVSQRLEPRRVSVTFNTAPKNKPNVVVNGQTVDTPKTLVSWEGYRLDVDAPRQVVDRKTTYVFASWSDGGAAAHTIVTPASAASYTATFRK